MRLFNLFAKTLAVVFIFSVVIFHSGCKKVKPHIVTEYDIEIRDGKLIPNSIDVIVGHEVVWENEDDTAHWIISGTPDRPEHLFESREIEPGGEYRITFDSVGSFLYFCKSHLDSMNGIVNVVEDTIITKTVIE